MKATISAIVDAHAEKLVAEEREAWCDAFDLAVVDTSATDAAFIVNHRSREEVDRLKALVARMREALDVAVSALDMDPRSSGMGDAMAITGEAMAAADKELGVEGA